MIETTAGDLSLALFFKKVKHKLNDTSKNNQTNLKAKLKAISLNTSHPILEICVS
jgi:hypothetical protein